MIYHDQRRRPRQEPPLVGTITSLLFRFILPLVGLAVSSCEGGDISSSSSTLAAAGPLLLQAQQSSQQQQRGVSFRGNRPKEHYTFQLTADSEEFPRCFQTSDELREAIKQYKSYKDFDESLATRYGWPIGNWCVGAIMDFGYAFQHKRWFNEPLSHWDTSRATNFAGMFQDCQSFNQDLSHFNTSNVVDMSNMFEAAIRFEGLGLERWNTEAVQNMDCMFLHALQFHNSAISHSWQIQNVRHMNGFLKDARSFTQEMHLDLLAMWQFHPHVDMIQMSDYWITSDEQQSTSTSTSSPTASSAEAVEEKQEKAEAAAAAAAAATTTYTTNNNSPVASPAAVAATNSTSTSTNNNVLRGGRRTPTTTLRLRRA